MSNVGVDGMLKVADKWFERKRIDDAITLLTEPEVHPLLRCNICTLVTIRA